MTAVALLQSTVAIGANGSIFSGIDTTLSGRARTAGENAIVTAALQRYDSLIALAHSNLSPYNTSAIVPLLNTALSQLNAAQSARDPELRIAIPQKLIDTQRAMLHDQA